MKEQSHTPYKGHMKKLTYVLVSITITILPSPRLSSQTIAVDDPILKSIWTEAMDSSALSVLAHQLLDVIGPRLVGTPQMTKAGTWAIEKYRSWGIEARTEQYGTWRGWERGFTHIDLLEPRVRTLEGTMLAWSPGTKKGGVKAPCIILPDVRDSLSFQQWLPAVKGKFILISQPQLTGRPDKNWEEFGTKESFDSLKARRERLKASWEQRIKNTGFKADTLAVILERAGAAGVFTNQWSLGWGVEKIFGTKTKTIPVLNLSLEDYNLVFRLIEHGTTPIVRVEAEAKFLGTVPAFNTIATIRGNQKPEEYVILSAHFDSWDGASGATDNGTGTLLMMEAMRILRKYYPTPRRTILVGHWGSEEQGLNGSRAFVKDHPEIVENLQALFNQDNGTGRIQSMSAAGFVDAGGHLGRWLSRVPYEVTQNLKVSFPGIPAGGGTDHASFVAAGVPAFGVGSLNWDYFAYTWHTNRDTYDKLVFDDLKNNVVLVASLAYLASEDPERVPREKRVMPIDKKTGKPSAWPTVMEPQRTAGGTE
jgi:hypothetical protein